MNGVETINVTALWKSVHGRIMSYTLSGMYANSSIQSNPVTVSPLSASPCSADLKFISLSFFKTMDKSLPLAVFTIFAFVSALTTDLYSFFPCFNVGDTQ